MNSIVKAMRWIIAVPVAFFISTVCVKILMFFASLRPDLGHLTAVFGGQIIGGAAFGSTGVLLAPSHKKLAWILFSALGAVIAAVYFAKFRDFYGAAASLIYICSVSLSAYWIYENSDESIHVSPQADRSAHPLGSMENPVKCHDPAGERHYLERLRDTQDFKSVSYKRIGSVSAPGSSNLLDRYEVVTSRMQTSTIFFDMYHKRHVEMQPVPGFLLFNTLAGNPTISPPTGDASLRELGKIGKLVRRCVPRDFAALRQILGRHISDEQCADILSFAFIRYGLSGNTTREDATKSLMIRTGLSEQEATAVYTFMLGE